MVQCLPLLPEDRDALMAALSGEPTSWRAASLIELLDQPNYLLKKLIDDAGFLLGFYVARKVADFAELLYIFVPNDIRGLGHGFTLLSNLVKEVEALKLNSVELEVRASNRAARHLYETAGFRVIGERANYYPASAARLAPREDAILYRLSLV